MKTQALWLAALLIMASGCAASGVRWQYDFERAYADSKTNKKLTMVYFRSPYSMTCTRVEDSVFKDPSLKEATANLACVALDRHWDRTLASAWDVTDVPAFVIVAPDGRILARRSGEFTVQDVRDAIDEAFKIWRPSPASAP
jgi:hypothetical protein